MNEFNKKKRKKKEKQSWFEKEILAYTNAVLSQVVRKALDDIFDGFKI